MVAEVNNSKLVILPSNKISFTLAAYFCHFVYILRSDYSLTKISYLFYSLIPAFLCAFRINSSFFAF